MKKPKVYYIKQGEYIGDISRDNPFHSTVTSDSDLVEMFTHFYEDIELRNSEINKTKSLLTAVVPLEDYEKLLALYNGKEKS